MKVDARKRLWVAGGVGGDARVYDTRTGALLAKFQFATADTFVNEYQVVIGETSWTLNFPGRDPVSATAVVDGDNIITDSEPFESVRMPGTMVTTHTVFHLEGDRLVGDVTATWQMEAGDSVGQLRTEGTRAP